MYAILNDIVRVVSPLITPAGRHTAEVVFTDEAAAMNCIADALLPQTREGTPKRPAKERDMRFYVDKSIYALVEDVTTATLTRNSNPNGREYLRYNLNVYFFGLIPIETNDLKAQRSVLRNGQWRHYGYDLILSRAVLPLLKALEKGAAQFAYNPTQDVDVAFSEGRFDAHEIGVQLSFHVDAPVGCMAEPTLAAAVPDDPLTIYENA
jgi:hypothetical protein